MPSQVTEDFANGDKKPLGELKFDVQLEDGVKCKMAALDKSWTSRSVFTPYSGLVAAGGQVKRDAEYDEWQHAAICFREDLDYLLSRRHHEFWSYMVYQKTALGAIVSFLQRATPFYMDLWPQLADTQARPIYEDILCRVLRILCRLLTPKESEEEWIAEEHHRELIYTNFLISVPMLFDLCIAVGDADLRNVAVLRKVFDSLLKIEPNYRKDLLEGLRFFGCAFRSIRTQAENEGCEGAGGGVLDDGSETPYDDVALYTLDCAYSLSVLLEVCPAVRSFCSSIGLGQSLAQFYDTTIPFLYTNISLINETASSLAWLNQARLQLLRAFRSIAYNYVDQVLSDSEDALKDCESLIALLTECLSYQVFVVDYERQYPVALDFEILAQACEDLDDYKVSYIVTAYQTEAEAEAFGTIGNIALTSAEAMTGGGPKAFDREQTATRTTELQALTNGSAVDGATGSRDIDLEVTAVLDVLPYLGTGFVRRVLNRYDTSEEAIAAILEENLPPDLLNIDQSEVYIPPDPRDALFRETGVQHDNFYDGDACDIMVQDEPKCIIKRGKGFPNGPQNATQLLDDKSHLQKVRHRYEEYSMVTENLDEGQKEYEDEYDDSYEALLESETRVVKSKALKAGLANVVDASDDDDEDDEDTSESAEVGKREEERNSGKRLEFCENPEEVRARYEARRQQKFASWRGGGKARSQDVVGAPKGQGQDKETTRNRNNKEAHKSSRANHNRKSGAAFKRSRGMVP